MNGNNSCRTVSSLKLFSRVGKLFGNLITTFILISGCVALTGCNDTRTAVLDEARRKVVSINPDFVDPALNGKLVYVNGRSETKKQLYDPDFDVAVDALILERHVEVYLWKEVVSETIPKMYSYEKTWSDRPISNVYFNQSSTHQNPMAWEFQPTAYFAQDAKVGNFSLNSRLLENMNEISELVDVTNAGRVNSQKNSEIKSRVPNNAVPYRDGYFIGKNPENPQIGDAMVRFFQVTPGVVSIVAGQRGSSLAPYTAGNGMAIRLIKKGTLSIDVLFDDLSRKR